MATHTYASLNIPEAQRLADLTGAKYDLEKAKTFAEKFIDELQKENDLVCLEAYSIAMLIQYSRAFVSGVRSIWSTSFNLDLLLSEDQRSSHERLKSWRDKHIAHSVNAFEESRPVARFCLERLDDEGVYGIECNHSRVVCPSIFEAELLIYLSGIFIKSIENEINVEKKRMLDLARKIPIEELLNPDRQKPMLVPGAQIDKRRKKVF